VFLTPETVDFGPIAARRPNRALAFLAVSRGCNRRCSYCVVPSARGPEVSRPIAELAAEARRLIEDGAVEITLLGQTIDTYGRDLGPEVTLARLLRELHRLPGLLRLRFVTSHPGRCREELFSTMRELGDKVMPFLHLPAQSGSDRVLRRMGRGYTRTQYLKVVEAARRLCPEIEFASDWMVGFCGETDEDFAQSLSLLEEVRFQSGYFFKYSPRPGTPAFRLPDDVPDTVKEERRARLAALQSAVSLAANRGRVGQVETVLAEGPSKRDPNRLTGRSRTCRLVHFPGQPELAGRLVGVKILSATALALTGEVVAR
jgi:tRNA-2-methylthio-N6-dimethylallyladenosine synthase